MFTIIKSVKTERHLGITAINPFTHGDIYVLLRGRRHLEATP